MGRSRLFIILLVLATFLVFGRICGHEFAGWDDPSTLHQNPRLNPPTLPGLLWYWRHAAMDIYIPLTYTLWAALAHVGRLQVPDQGIALNPWVFHTASVLVHLLSVLAAFALLKRLFKSEPAAAFGALLFGLHPVQVETVAWASGMKDLLCGLFALLALGQYVAYAQAKGAEGTKPYALAAGCFVLAMLSKPTGMILPLLAGIIDLLVVGRSWKKAALALGPWLVLSAACAAVARLAQPAEGVPLTALWARPLIVGDALAFYLYKLLWPAALATDYGRRPAVVLASSWAYLTWLAPATLGLFLWWRRRLYPELAAGGLLFVAGALPVLGFTPFLFQYYSTTADHYLYLSMLGPALALAWALSRYPGRRAFLACGIALTLLGARSLLQAGHWQSNPALWTQVLEVNPNSWIAHRELGAALERQGKAEAAAAHYRQAVQAKPDDAQAHQKLARHYAQRQQWPEAIEATRRYIGAFESWPAAKRPNLAAAHEELGLMLLAQNRPAEALQAFERARHLDPHRPGIDQKLQQAQAAAKTSPAASPGK